MHLLSLLFLGGVAVWASPIETRAQATDVYEACKHAKNCEVYIDDSGMQRVRFKDGMGLGSAHYKRHVEPSLKRDDAGFQTFLTYGDQKAIYGCDEPGKINPWDMTGWLGDLCIPPTCVTTDVKTLSIPFIESNPGQRVIGPPAPTNWELRGEGEYPPPLHNAFVLAIQQMSNTSVQRTTQQYSTLVPRDVPFGSEPTANCEMVEQSNFFNVVRFSNDLSSIQGHMTATVSVPAMDKGACDFLGDAKELGDAVTAVKGIGDWVGGIFGVINAACKIKELADGGSGGD